MTALRANSDLILGDNFAVLAVTAFRPNSDLSLAESFAMRAFPPLRPPSLPSATAAGFFRLLDDLRERLGINDSHLSESEFRVAKNRGSSK